MPYASRRDPDDLEGLAAALEALVGTEYDEQVFVWVDGTPEGHSLDVVHSTEPIDGELLAPRAGSTPPGATSVGRVDDGADDDWAEDDEDDWAESGGRYLVYVGYGTGPVFAEREVPVPEGTVLVDDDGTGATVALPELPIEGVIAVLSAWARAVLGGAAIGGLWWATTFADDEDGGGGDDDGRHAGNGTATT